MGLLLGLLTMSILYTVITHTQGLTVVALAEPWHTLLLVTLAGAISTWAGVSLATSTTDQRAQLRQYCCSTSAC